MRPNAPSATVLAIAAVLVGLGLQASSPNDSANREASPTAPDTTESGDCIRSLSREHEATMTWVDSTSSGLPAAVQITGDERGGYDYSIYGRVQIGPLSYRWSQGPYSIQSNDLLEIVLSPGPDAFLHEAQLGHPTAVRVRFEGTDPGTGVVLTRGAIDTGNVFVTESGAVLGPVQVHSASSISGPLWGESEDEGVDTGEGPGRLAGVSLIPMVQLDPWEGDQEVIQQPPEVEVAQ